jgi:hypothetical protein
MMKNSVAVTSSILQAVYVNLKRRKLNKMYSLGKSLKK